MSSTMPIAHVAGESWPHYGARAPPKPPLEAIMQLHQPAVANQGFVFTLPTALVPPPQKSKL